MTGIPVTLIMPKHVGRCSVSATYIDHSIGSDAEEGGSLVHCFDLLPSLHGDFQTLEFTQGTLQGRPVLGDQIITCAEVVELADKYLQGALNLAAVRLGCRLLVPRVIWKGEARGHIQQFRCLTAKYVHTFLFMRYFPYFTRYADFPSYPEKNCVKSAKFCLLISIFCLCHFYGKMFSSD